MDERRQQPARTHGAILVVDDEKAVRAVIRLALEREGYTVLTASDGDEVDAILAQHKDRIVLAIVDVVLPRSTGRELYKSLAARQPGGKVLFASGDTKELAQQYGLLDEGAPFIAKPFSVTDLVRRVRELLSRGEPPPCDEDPREARVRT